MRRKRLGVMWGLLLVAAIPLSPARAQRPAPRQASLGVRAVVMPLRQVQPDSLLARRAALVVRDSTAVRTAQPRVRLVAYVGN